MPSNVIQKFQIQQITLASASCERSDEEYIGFARGEKLAYRLGRGENYGIAAISLTDDSDNEALICRVTVGLACKVFSEEALIEAREDADPSEIEAVCEVRTTYDADYLVRDSSGDLDEFDSDELNSFAEHNVPYHVWPFFREHLCSTLCKMQIEPLTIPMLLVPAVHQKPVPEGPKNQVTGSHTKGITKR